ncbi:hypothetical protein QE152_g9614 [Popillia japonica]|uniref:Uncharacterized protein n=1 Tax=Popillia japonica TaxID=7064 RepID=A0AAW1LXV9_POPJA
MNHTLHNIKAIVNRVTTTQFELNEPQKPQKIYYLKKKVERSSSKKSKEPLKHRRNESDNVFNLNTSYIEIVRDHFDEGTTESEIMTDLRDKLASVTYRVRELEDQLDLYKNKIEYYQKNCANQKNTIEILKKSISEIGGGNRCIVLHAQTQTDSYTNTKESQTVELRCHLKPSKQNIPINTARDHGETMKKVANVIGRDNLDSTVVKNDAVLETMEKQ